MKRILTWGIVAAAAIFCVAGGLYLYRAILDYGSLQRDIGRQQAEMDTLRLEQSRPTAPADARSVSETVGFISSQIGGFQLAEKSLQTEMGGAAQGEWEEWRIQAVCTGTMDELNAFVDSLETSGSYHNLNFTLDFDNGDNYDLNIELSFYASRV